MTSSGDSSLMALQGNSGKRQVGSVRLVSVAPDACSAGGRVTSGAPPGDPNSCFSSILPRVTSLCFSCR